MYEISWQAIEGSKLSVWEEILIWGDMVEITQGRKLLQMPNALIYLVLQKCVNIAWTIID